MERSLSPVPPTDGWRRRQRDAALMATKGKEVHHIDVDNIDDAVTHILAVLHDTYDQRDDRRVLYFDGWKGLGASVILRTIANLLKSGRYKELRFHIIIHIDCSFWKSRRAMQRTIAEELKLDYSVMAMFDKQDELDDFRGEPDGSREEIWDVARKIREVLVNRRFLVIFHNRSDYKIDINALGIPPLDKYSESRMMWTYRGRFHISFPTKEMLNDIPNVITMSFKTKEKEKKLENWHAILLEEATEVVEYTGMHDIKPAVVVDCFLYKMFMQDNLDWDAHTCNYWISDGIIQGYRAWEVGNALQTEMRCDALCEWFDEDYKDWLSLQKPYKNWSKMNDVQFSHNVPYPQDETSSYLLTCEDQSSIVALPKDLFARSKKLRVLKLALCAFDFASPPFLYCNSLRLLCLDHCTNNGRGGEVENKKMWPCLQSLWVLDLRYTDWSWILSPEIMELMTHLKELNIRGPKHWTLSLLEQWLRLHDVHKLRVMELSFIVVVNGNTFTSMPSLELLDLSGNDSMQVLPRLSSVRNLKVLVLDGCVGLEHVVCENLPLLESFSFDGYGSSSKWKHSMQLPRKELRPNSYIGPKDAKITYISLKDCARLENLFLRGLPNLEELDLSGTLVKRLDMELPQLKRLFLLGCERLRWINLGANKGRKWDVLHIDTRGKGNVDHCRTRSIHAQDNVHLVFTDGRCLPFLVGEHMYDEVLLLSSDFQFHLHISSSVHSQIECTNKEINLSEVRFILARSFPYNDVFVKSTRPPSWASPVLQPSHFHVEIGEGSSNLEGTRESEALAWAMDWAGSAHVHDNSSITTMIPNSPGYNPVCTFLKWCHVERCPKLHSVVSDWEASNFTVFYNLEIFWASHLLTARWIWSKGTRTLYLSFYNLQYIHLDNCPRLMFVLPLSTSLLHSLETIHIEYCSDLMHVFPVDEDDKSIAANYTIEFSSLKRILLQELPKLQQICEAKMSAPKLETIKIRGCWSLRRLPAVQHQHKKPTVDCEKEWWDKLEWDNNEANHQPSLFEPCHSRYYKKTLPKGSLLR